MYKNCTVSYKLKNKTVNVEFSTGVQQGDNALPVLFTYVMQAFLDTLQKDPLNSASLNPK
jgi:hypothetical protein